MGIPSPQRHEENKHHGLEKKIEKEKRMVLAAWKGTTNRSTVAKKSFPTTKVVPNKFLSPQLTTSQISASSTIRSSPAATANNRRTIINTNILSAATARSKNATIINHHYHSSIFLTYNECFKRNQLQQLQRSQNKIKRIFHYHPPCNYHLLHLACR